MVVSIQDIEKELIGYGYNEFKNKTANRIAIVTDKNRYQVMQEVANILEPFGARYIEDYTTSKAALIGMTKTLAVELAKYI